MQYSCLCVFCGCLQRGVPLLHHQITLLNIPVKHTAKRKTFTKHSAQSRPNPMYILSSRHCSMASPETIWKPFCFPNSAVIKSGGRNLGQGWIALHLQKEEERNLKMCGEGKWERRETGVQKLQGRKKRKSLPSPLPRGSQERGVPVVAQWLTNPTRNVRFRVRSLPLLSGLRIWRCCELWCRL